jgi:CRISPR/Cas system CSM-associated protein Csm3 (group 7 of RAMP superfamily)
VTRNDRLEVAYDLTFTTPFHFGTGLRVGLIDRTVVKDAEGYLYVPGSTIKGVVREQCEWLARLYGERPESICSPHDAVQALWAQGQQLSMITRIFGSQNVPGRLFFDDARQDKESKAQYDSREGRETIKGKYKAIQTDLSTQVRLDRPTRTAARGALYTSEFGIKDMTFKGVITGWLECTSIAGYEEGPTYSLLLLLAGLHLFDRLGGNKSTGKGQCRCEITALTYGKKMYAKEEWQVWFDSLEDLFFYPTEEDA